MEIYYYISKFSIIQHLPLLFMIMNGSMSFVGSQIIAINNEDPGLMIRPGLTSLKEIKKNNNICSLRDYEEYYALNYSLIYDIEIIIKSILHI